MRVCLLILCLLGTAFGQNQPRIFIGESSSWEIREFGEGGARPQNAEIAKTFVQRCPAVRVNNRKEMADYLVVLEHEGGKGWGQRDNKVAVYNRDGDMLYGGSTAILGNAVKDACAAITSDWKRKNEPATTPTAKKAVGTIAVTMHRTERHSKYSGADVAYALVDEATLYLKAKGIPTTAEGGAFTLDLVVDRPISKWVKVTLRMSDEDGKLLWEEVAESGGGMNGAYGLKKTIERMRAILDRRITAPPVAALQ